MRFALAAEGSRGDVQPMVGLAARLIERGHQAMLCAPPDLRRLVEDRGLEFRPLGTDIHSLLAENADTLHRGAVVWALQSKRVFQRVLSQQFEALPRAAAGADMIIGGGVQFAGPSVSEAWGIPYLPIAYCPALLRSADYPPAVVPNQSLPRWVNRLAWGGFLRLQDHLLRRDQLDHSGVGGGRRIAGRRAAVHEAAPRSRLEVTPNRLVE